MALGNSSAHSPLPWRYRSRSCELADSADLVSVDLTTDHQPHYVVDPSSTRRRSSPPTDHQDSRSPSTAQALTPVAAGITANRIDDARGPDRLMHAA
ncbi:MAG: hypothetical protein K0Q46_2742 [Rhodococcus erythropolis]|nr:hypothetical protein [Rhodococcus erythropolis]MDF2895956.1 hypothetical protein [Rhodococcus erythropolis]